MAVDRRFAGLGAIRSAAGVILPGETSDVPRDTTDDSGRRTGWTGEIRRLLARWAAGLRGRWLGLGLPGKLLLLTAAFVMLDEVFIFVHSVANYRISWLTDRLTAAELAAVAAEALPGGEVPASLREELLRTARVKAVALRSHGMRRLVLAPSAPLAVDAHYDLREPHSRGIVDYLARRLAGIRDALAAFLAPDGRTLRVIGPHGAEASDFIEIVLPEAPLRAAMIRYGFNVLAISVLISLITAALVYLALSSLLVRPMMRITRSMVSFSHSPEDASRIIVPSGRSDEIGTAERELARMQQQLSQALIQKNRLAQLGLAVSKINHDLRNMLANAQLISDRLTTVPDPTVQRFAPKLIASLDRAINFCNSSLRYGKAEEAAPRRELMRLKPLVEEVGDSLGLPREGLIDFVVDIDDTLRIDADREHLFRILNNLARNAVQAIEGQGGAKGEIRISARREGRRVLVEVRDSGPGVPPKARENLFRAFQGSARKGGGGRGLTIAAELVAAHGGQLQIVDSVRGAAFLIDLPDRQVR